MRAATAFLIALIAIYSSGVLSDKPANQFETDILAAHNKYRAKHGAPPLSWSSQIQKVAQEWADHLASLGKMEHRPKGQYGENIYAASNMKNAPNTAAVDAWYNEVKDYDFKKNEFGYKTGHFSQVVWKGSKLLGVGKATKGNKEYIVANYDPRGNIIGQFKENVLPSK